MKGSWIFDIVSILLCLSGGFLSSSKGFFLEASSKMSYLTGLLFSLMLTNSFSVFIIKRLDYEINPILLSFLSFCILFIIFSFLTKYLGVALGRMMEKQEVLKFLDKILGFALGIFEMFCLITIIATILEHQKIFDLKGVLENSFFYNLICQNMKILFNLGLENLSKIKE